MNAHDFNALYRIGDPVVHDPAPLLGEPMETCTVALEAWDQESESGDGTWISLVKLRRPSGEDITARLDNLAL